MAALYVVLAFVALVAYLWKSISRKDLPPGPPPLPIIGNTHQFIYGSLKGKTNVQVMKEWRKTYGPVYTMWLGPMPVVLTCDYKTSMEAFVNHGDAQSDRPDTFCFTKMRNRLGLIFSTGPGWQEQRRFSMQTLRDFGFGKNIMQQRILEEANFRFGFWDKLIEESEKGYIVTNPQNYIDLIVGSIINVLIVGYRYDDSNMAEFIKLRRSVDLQFDIITQFDFVLFNEITHRLPFLKNRWNLISAPVYNTIDYMKKQVEERRAKIASGEHEITDEPEDYIDSYFKEIERRKVKGEPMGWFNDESLAVNLNDLWVAGSETTVTTLLWSLVYLLNYPEIQDKMRKEILSVTGGNRSVELTDRTVLPYTMAVITETHRCTNLLNFNVLHKTACDTVMGDFIVPKGTTTTCQLSLILEDEADFVNPEQFSPDRYLENKKLAERVIPFSVGKRSCLGESLARAEMFLILPNLIQNYKISVPEGQKPPRLGVITTETMLKRSDPFEMKIEKVH